MREKILLQQRVVPKKNYITKWTNLLCKVRKNEQTKFTEERHNKKKIEQLGQDSNGLETFHKAEVYLESKTRDKIRSK